jgi:hypothetical protein
MGGLGHRSMLVDHVMDGVMAKKNAAMLEF